MRLILAQPEVDFYNGSWPDNQGNYPIREQYHGTWQVVDTDPNGLSCRSFRSPDRGSEKIITRFPNGTLINTFPRGRGLFEIENNSVSEPWLLVRLFGREEGQECWVRANQKYVIPIRPEKIS